MKMMSLARLFIIHIMRNIPQRGFFIISRSVESAEEDGFSESKFQKFHNENVKPRNYCLNSDEEVFGNGDIFENPNKKVKDFRKILKIPPGEDNLDSLL